MQRSSSLTQHLTFFSRISSHFSSNTHCVIIYLDLSIPHNKLIIILQNWQINSFIFKWIEDYHIISPHTVSQVTSLSAVPFWIPWLFTFNCRSHEMINSVSLFVYSDDINLISSNPSKLQTSLHAVENWCMIQ